MIKAVFIDIDGTLLDFEACVEESMRVGLTENGIEYVLVKNFDRCNSIRVKSSLLGDFQVMNSLEAITAAELCGIDAVNASLTLEEIKGIKGRLEQIDVAEKEKILMKKILLNLVFH